MIGDTAQRCMGPFSAVSDTLKLVLASSSSLNTMALVLGPGGGGVGQLKAKDLRQVRSSIPFPHARSLGFSDRRNMCRSCPWWQP